LAIVGCGVVRSTSAYALLTSGVGREIVLVDLNRARAEAEANDIYHTVPFAHQMTVHAGDYADPAGTSVVVIAGGVAQKPGETRLQLHQRNADVFRQIVPSTLRHAVCSRITGFRDATGRPWRCRISLAGSRAGDDSVAARSRGVGWADQERRHSARGHRCDEPHMSVNIFTPADPVQRTEIRRGWLDSAVLQQLRDRCAEHFAQWCSTWAARLVSTNRAAASALTTVRIRQRSLRNPPDPLRVPEGIAPQ
jgi:hypothetical protein